ncbi:molybdenum cofactor cytidylyltransferase [Shewanella sp. UCD-KL12]|uniref:molybdenum cofactor cytidylyltransferase n=1 Tax=Shewanella sp. UCD-KL12 TaxID=1917163 RepID=UPI0009705B66|nr:molybdenum cofactor cytidylyltransferase [Shewanella sp. UCD-KL12]
MMPTAELIQDKAQVKEIDCIMPAAGLSSRMGQWKMMLPFNNQTILAQSIENALKFCSRVILVAGFRADELVKGFQGHPNVTVVVNSNFEDGMLSSIKVGLASVKSEHFFIAHGDMPCIKTEIYRACWQQRGDYSLFPGNQEQTGHPVLLPKTLIPSIVNSEQTGSLRKILMQSQVKYLHLEDESLLLDVDTPEAYQQLLLQSSN